MGFFLTIEGVEGAGKTTAKAVVLRWLQACGREFIATREPGGTPLAEQLRALVLGDLEQRRGLGNIATASLNGFLDHSFLCQPPGFYGTGC